MNIRLHVKYPLLFSRFNQTWIFVTDFRKTLKCQIHENLSSGSRDLLREQRLTDKTILIVAFLDLPNPLKNSCKSLPSRRGPGDDSVCSALSVYFLGQ
jgi:hypothetical protein